MTNPFLGHFCNLWSRIRSEVMFPILPIVCLMKFDVTLDMILNVTLGVKLDVTLSENLGENFDEILFDLVFKRLLKMHNSVSEF